MDFLTTSSRPTTMEMVQKPSPLSFLGRRTAAPRPLSESTDFFDTDGEDDSVGSSPASLESLDDDSQSTASSRELKTPLTAGLGGFEFHFDEKPIEGPFGPHLFSNSPDLEDQIRLHEGWDLPKVPIEQQHQTWAPPIEISLQEHEILQSPVDEPRPQQSRPFTSLNTAVAELDETQVRNWTPQQVADWMADAGFESAVVDKFLIHDISGSVLLELQFEDLKELDISSFGKRHRVMSSIHHLRNSSAISMESPINRSPSKSPATARSLQRNLRPDDCFTVVGARSKSQRRGRSRPTEDVTPAESISIVAIEQLLPKPHVCSKGEDCPKWQKRQRKLLQIQQEFAVEEPEQPKSDAEPSVVGPSVIGSSDILGPTPPFKITAQLLQELEARDPQDNVRQFLNFQRVCSPSHSSNPSPPPAASAIYAAKSIGLEEHLRDLPKLTIPSANNRHESPARTPITMPRMADQAKVQQLRDDPYHYGGVASPADIFRIDTPFSATDIPVTNMPIDPCQRDVSQSVPPDMRYGAADSAGTVDPVNRCGSAAPRIRRHARQQSFAPSIAPVRENTVVDRFGPEPPVDLTEANLSTHQGWMRKRKTTKLMRHEWQDNYCTLNGSTLACHADENPQSKTLDTIDVDEYVLHAYSLASGSKLSAAFKKSLLGQDRYSTSEPSFAFSLIPEGEATRKFFEKSKSHHFTVDSSKERVEWMRKLMLAKAMKKNDNYQI